MTTSKALDLLGPLPSFESLGRELVAAIQNGRGCGLAVPQELADLIARARDADPNAVGSLCAQDPACYEKPIPCPHHVEQPAPAPVQVENYRDAYEGAREDLLDWKRRALRAEATLRTLGYTGIDASQPPAPGEAVLPSGCLDALRAYQQADEDGTFVKVSRQALDAAIAALAQQRVPDAVKWLPLDRMTAPPTGRYVVGHRGHSIVAHYLNGADSAWSPTAKIGWQEDPFEFGATHYFPLPQIAELPIDQQQEARK